MKKSELKDLINPIVKECVNENIQAILLESGLLSQVISEVVKGLQPVLVENKNNKTVQHEQVLDEIPKRGSDDHMREILKRSKENRKISLDNEIIQKKVSFKNINIFEGIQDSIPDEAASSQPGNALSGIAPDDPGVDIAGLFDPKIASMLLKGNKR